MATITGSDIPDVIRRPLLQLYKERAVRVGDFTLASGQKSRFYIDSKLVFMNSQAADLIGTALHYLIAPLQPDAVGGLEVGAIPPTMAFLAVHNRYGRQAVEGFFVRKLVKDHGNAKLIEGKVNGGDRVVVIEDVFTSGQSAYRAVEALETVGARVLAVVTLVDRSSESSLFTPETDRYPRLSVFSLEDFEVART